MAAEIEDVSDLSSGIAHTMNLEVEKFYIFISMRKHIDKKQKSP